MDLSQISTTEFSGVGAKVAGKLEKLNIRTAQDVLFHLPFRYEDRTRYTDLGFAQAEQSILVRGLVETVQQIPHGRRSLIVRLHDGTGALNIRLFHYSYAQKQAFQVGRWVECFGELLIRPGSKEMIHPEYRVLTEKPQAPLDDALTPVYPSTEGVSQHLLRKLTDQALKKYLPAVTELLPVTVQQEFNFISLQKALQQLHRPGPELDSQSMLETESPIFQRLIFEELLAFHLGLKKIRAKRQQLRAKPCLMPTEGTSDQLKTGFVEQFQQNLGFNLTDAQHRCVTEIQNDLRQAQPMMRLLQGDVGSGKTVVAALAILQAYQAGQQVALMAPTELLAEQLYRTLEKWFTPLRIPVGWLAGKLTATQRKPVLTALASNELRVVVGTHALFQKEVVFQQLGLVVIDEQHRFGVGQRLALRDKSSALFEPHQLIMSATPIPRTLAMSFYADIDVSTIDELPPGRLPVETVVVSAPSKRTAVIERVSHACHQQTQVYWVCPLIDESEKLQAQAVTEAFKELEQQLKGVRIGMVHGQMKSAEKESIMQRFREHEIDLLLATTVIEVGVDVPNASLMIIENAERMGLAQLHQLRGRVGRGSKQSVCVLMYQPPLSNNAKIRLQTLRETNDGFKIARKDLELRGPGEILGVRQTGAVNMRIANLVRDEHWLSMIEREADKFEQNNPELILPLTERWIALQEQFVNA